MLRAWRSWDTYEAGTNCRAWLMTILRNTFINEFRRKKSRPDPVDFDDEFRITLVLADVDGLSYREISEQLGIPEGTVESRLYRARRRLQNELYEYARSMGYLTGEDDG